MKNIINNVVWSTYLFRTELKAFQWDLKRDDPQLNAKLQKTIKKRGFDAPIYVWHWHENYILDGHQRLKALNALADTGLMLEDDKIPVVYIKADTLEQAKEKVLEYNSKYSEFDMGELASFSEWLDLDGLWIDWLDDLFEDDKEEKEDSVPADDWLPPLVQYGDIFQVWPHRIMCGDSTKEEDVALLMDGRKADMVRTDPPYNVWYKWHAEATKDGIMNDKMDSDSFYQFLKDAFNNIKLHTKIGGGGIYVWHNHKEQIAFENALKANSLEIKQQIIWNKPSLGLWAGDYRPKHEVFFYAVAKWSSTTFYGDRTHSTVVDLFKEKTDEQILKMIKRARSAESQGKSTVFSIKRDNVTEYVHPTQKPVALCELSVNNSSKQEDIVLDLFLGSGVAMITAEKSGRVCYGMELDPKFVEVILKRYYDYANKDDIRCLNRDLDINLVLHAK